EPLALPAELQSHYRQADPRKPDLMVIASRDPATDEPVFPPRPYGGDTLAELERMEFAGKGRIYAFTVIRVKPPYGLPAPYAVGYVDLDQAPLRLFGLFAPERVDRLAVGLPVVLRARALGFDNLERPCLRPVFEPDEAGS
ncbi:MAG: OB-fold domain-containing protein, partial [Rhodospirillales bacterium]|nr:OB-fold domain-containing protein [Rhodospirillales bacterium]